MNICIYVNRCVKLIEMDPNSNEYEATGMNVGEWLVTYVLKDVLSFIYIYLYNVKKRNYIHI